MSSYPFGYLLTVLILAWSVYYTLTPLGWSRFVNPYSLGLRFSVVNEVPFLALLWLLLSSWLALSQGQISSPLAWLTFGLGVMTMLGLLKIILLAVPSMGLLNHALDKALGNGWRSGISPRLAARLRRGFSATAVLGPFGRRRWDVQRIANIAYGDAGVYNMLDVYRHRSKPKNSPVFIHVHGGGFRSGRKDRDALPILYRLASQGWLCVSINYRLSPGASFPDYLVDVKKAIAWVRRHGSEYGADPSTIIVAGGSVGGQLAALAALTADQPKFQPGFEQADTSVAAAVVLYANYNWADSAEAMPVSHIKKDAPPFLVLHGTKDLLVPVQDAEHFARKLLKTSDNPVVYAQLPGGHHNFDQFNSIRGQAVERTVEAFADWVRQSGRR